MKADCNEEIRKKATGDITTTLNIIEVKRLQGKVEGRQLKVSSHWSKNIG